MEEYPRMTRKGVRRPTTLSSEVVAASLQRFRPSSTSPHGVLVLASGSPRRVALMREAGFEPEVEPADIDDGQLVLGETDARDVAPALAHFKARRVAARRSARGAPDAWILAADTVCERDGAVLGKPKDAAEARDMIRSLANRPHGVVTGWCLWGPDATCRVGRDIATIVIGEIDAADLDRFIDEGLWRGKAGGYNLPEVLARGWPVHCEGDPQTVVGLPVRRLTPLLRAALAGRLGDADHA
ncbi:MAG: Maf family protein [bacterium]